MDLDRAQKELSRAVAYCQMIFRIHGDPDNEEKYDPKLVLMAVRALTQAIHPLVKVIELGDVEKRLAEVEKALKLRT